MAELEPNAHSLKGVNITHWERIQDELSNKVKTINADSINCMKKIKLVGGLDISFRLNSCDEACVSLVVLKYPSLERVFAHFSHVKMTQPYVSGFLGFREVEYFKAILDEVKQINPSCFPQILLVDGNGLLHARQFGSACHIGVEYDIPTIGVAKNLLSIYDYGILNDDAHKQHIRKLNKSNNTFPIITNTNKILGMAVLTGKTATKPVYVSVGHNIDLDTAVEIVINCSCYRIPEPIRLADILSREELRIQFPNS